MRKFRIKNLALICTLILFCVNISTALEQNPKTSMISGQLTKSLTLSSIDMLNLFKQNLALDNEISYNIVPRGLVVSINSEIFFEDGEDELKESSKQTLNQLGQIIKYIDKPCEIEGHTTNLNSETTSNWEISMMRAEKIVNYLIENTPLNPKNIRAIGFGDIVPHNYKSDLDKRIDFVIITYD